MISSKPKWQRSSVLSFVLINSLSFASYYANNKIVKYFTLKAKVQNNILIYNTEYNNE